MTTNVLVGDMTPLTRAALSCATAELGPATGWFRATRLRNTVRFEWAGGNTREAHAALLRSFALVNIHAEDIPGFGVRTGLDVLMGRGEPLLFLRILRDLRAQYRGTQRRFAAKVLRRGPDECWPWLGFCSARLERKNRPGTFREPYGKFVIRRNGVRRNILAHRWALFGIAALTRKEHALHTCDNTMCCNPAHLYAGTQRENLRDAEDRNRIARNSGTFAKAAPHIGDVIHSGIDTRIQRTRFVDIQTSGRVANANHTYLPAMVNVTIGNIT